MQHPILLTLIDSKLVQAFCWMLVHSLWIGLLAVLLTGIVLTVTVNSRPAVRYRLLTAIFVLFLASCGTAFLFELLSPGVTLEMSVLPDNSAAGATGLKPLLQAFLDLYAANTLPIMTVWTLLFCRKALLLTGALAYNYRLRREALPLHDYQWTERFAQLTAKLGITRPVLFVESAVVHIPVVIGYVKPMIFLPMSMLTQLSPATVEAVVLHELAHIKRQDYLVNLCQLLAEAVFSFNPALLWLSAILREEREYCCDDLAIATTKNRKGFVQALISFRERASTTYVLAFPASKNNLLKRVSRIVHNQSTPPDAAGKAFLIASFILLAILVKASTDKMATDIPEELVNSLTRPQASNFSTHASTAARDVTASSKKKKTTSGAKKSDKHKIGISVLKREDQTATVVERIPIPNPPTITGTDVPVHMIPAELPPNEKVHYRGMLVNGRVEIRQVRNKPPDHIQAQKEEEQKAFSVQH